MLSSFSPFGRFWLLLGTAFGSDLFSTLRSSDANLFADALESNPALCALFSSSEIHTIFAPVDSVLTTFPLAQRSWVIAREGPSPETAKELAIGAATQWWNIVTNTSHAEDLVKRTEDSLPFLFTTASDDIPANLEGGSRQKFTLIDGKSQRKGSPPQGPRSNESALQVVTGLGNKVTVVKPGIQYDGGSIHTIDGLLTVPTKLSETLATLPNTTLFGALLNSSNLTTTFDKQRGGTFFIPSDVAIAALGCNQTLSTATIQNHRVQGISAYLPLLKDCQTLQTASGGVLTVKKSTDGEYTINGANIISTNIILENGVAYVIDRVLTSTSPPIDNAASSSLWSTIRCAGALAFSVVFAGTMLA